MGRSAVPFAGARVDGPPHVLEAVEPSFLAQVGRDLIRSGDSMHVIDVDRDGRVTLLPCSSWHWEGSAHPSSWTVRATFYGPIHEHHETLTGRRRGVRSLGIDSGPALRRDRAALLGAHDGAPPERNRAFPCR